MKFKAFIYQNPLGLISALILLIFSVSSYFVDFKIFVSFTITFGLVLLIDIIFFVFNFKNTKKYIEQINKSLTADTADAVSNFPLPAIISDKHGNITWFNKQFEEDVLESFEINKLSMKDFFDDFSFTRLAEERVSDAHFADREYTAFSMPLNNSAMCFYLFDDTYLKDIANKYHFSRPFVMLILVDNIEQLSRGLTDSKFALVSSGIESRVEEWLKEEEVILKKIGNGNFLVIGEKRNLDNLSENKFSVLNEVRNYSYNGTPVNATLSIGVGTGETFRECENKARKALDMSLGRGGDQAAVYTENGYIYFGGVSNRSNDNSRVSPRQTAANISTLLKQYGKVFVMGHKYSDYDAIGAAMGMQYFAEANGLEAYVVVDSKTTLSSALVNFSQEKGFKAFITPSKALDLCDDDTVVIVVDTHRHMLLDSSDLYDLAGTTVVIDHHRLADDYIEDAEIFYSSPSPSSTCEMVAELIEYSTIQENLPSVVATALLSGIVLDTKDYVLRTSQRTFEAAGFLRDNGADTVEVRKLFSIDADMASLKNEIISESKIHNGFMVGSTLSDNKNLRIVTSSAADEMLNIEGVKASFVLSKIGVGKIQISARSLGEENVQLIMEKLGGGGHSTMAAAQIKGANIEQAKQMLLDAIDEYIFNK